MMKSILFVVNVDWFFISHRLPIALKAMEQGYNVGIVTTVTHHREELESHGLKVHDLTISRGSSNVISTVYMFFKLLIIFYSLKPDIIHLVTIKPVLVGGLAAIFLKCKGLVFSISGMGYVFIQTGIINFFRRKIVSLLYRISLSKKNMKVIFQNISDKRLVSKIANLKNEKMTIIKGSGVDLDQFQFSELSDDPIILLASRMLVDKGVIDFVEAAKILKEKIPSARFVLVGSPDKDNNSSLQPEEINKWVEDGLVEYWGHKKDIYQIIKQAKLVVLPSYREGMPKILLEAAATGRAVITTDVPGCRDAIIPEVTGLLVNPKDPLDMANKIELLFLDETRCKSMGIAGRKFAEENFSLDSVIQAHLDIYSSFFNERLS